MQFKISVISGIALLLCGTLAAAVHKAGKAGNSNSDVELFADAGNKIAAFTGLLPPGVKTVACISPGFYPGAPGYKKGIAMLREAGYKVQVFPNAFALPEEGKRSAALEKRLSDFYAAWNDPEIDMIICIRGGWGCGEVMRKVDWSKLPRRKNLYVQGYSDVTMILCALQKRGYGHPVAGPMIGAMSGLDAAALADMKAMHNKKAVGPFPVVPLVKGDCRGLALAGLLERFVWGIKTTDRPITKDRIIFIESVGINAAAIRKNMQILLDEKFFEGAKAVVFGYLDRSDIQDNEDVIREYAPKLGVPVYMGFHFGHRKSSRTIDFEREAVIKNNTVFFPAPEI